MEFRSGDALFEFDGDLKVVSWNRAAEELTGVPAAEAVGRYCWQLLHAVDDWGATVCHAGCSYARLAREGWPVPGHELVIKTPGGGRRIHLSTILVKGAERPLLLHLMRDGLPARRERGATRCEFGRPLSLTARQQEVLELLAQGVSAKVIAARLGLSETTVRNHIRAILLKLGCHSQLEALAKARSFGLVV